MHDWQQHLQPLGRLAAIATAAAQLRDAEQLLDEAVITARTTHPRISWDEIGRATGMTRQSAHVRWAARAAQGESR